jgi:Tol biopolymer transport system component
MNCTRYGIIFHLTWVLLLLFRSIGSAAQPLITTRVSVDSNGNEGNNYSYRSSISADRRYIAFDSTASNLVASDTNDTNDIFIHDRLTKETTRVSVNSGGIEGNDYSESPSISADGRYVAFHSWATNLVAGDANGAVSDILIHDRLTKETTLVSVDSNNTQGNQQSYFPSISADGRYVAFQSSASNLVTDDTNNTDDIFVHDRLTKETTRVSVNSSGIEGNNFSNYHAISADGQYVAFTSLATNLVDNDTNGREDIFVHNRQDGTTSRVSVHSNGTEGDSGSYNPSISADGQYVAFESSASNLVASDTNGATSDVFFHDRLTGATTLVSVDSSGIEGNSYSDSPSISADGRYIAFESHASNLVASDINSSNDVFIHDRQTEKTIMASVDSSGSQGDWASFDPSISADGQYVAFTSNTTNLIANDTNNTEDIFVRGPGEFPWVLFLPSIIGKKR